jgi:hypothetical protein
MIDPSMILPEPPKDKPLLTYLISGSLMVNPRRDKSHLMLLAKVRALGGEQDIVPCHGGWILRNPRNYTRIPWIKTAMEELDRQLKLPFATPSLTVSSGSSVPRQS